MLLFHHFPIDQEMKILDSDNLEGHISTYKPLADVRQQPRLEINHFLANITV